MRRIYAICLAYPTYVNLGNQFDENVNPLEAKTFVMNK